MGGGGHNSLNTKNSKPQKLTKNPKKIQESKKDSKTISKIGISIIASVLLSQNLAALPAGGKFIHGSGSISKNGNTMDITGNNRNHVIAWGGGFNINNGERVNFNGSGKAFLNLDYSNKASRILGTLNGGGNNIYLVNPSGVLIGEGGKVNNVGRFVASTSSLDKALTQFVDAAKKNGDQNAVNFSPVFTRGSLKGNVINMGTINANNIMLVGNEVRNLTSNGTKDVQGKYNNTGNLHIIGSEIFLDVEGVANKKNIRLTGTNDVLNSTPKITVQMAMSTFKTNGHNDWITKDYSINGSQFGTGSYYVDRIITIGGTGGWNDFANAWNNNWGITRNIEEFKLISNLNFSGVDFVSVGKPQGAGFSKIFNGNGYTMSNITLDNNDASNNGGTGNNGTITAGIFNKVGSGTIKNLTIDRVTADITTNQAPTLHFGAFAGQINGGTIENVTLNNINIKGSIDYSYANGPTNDNGYMGGFAGVINRGNIKNVSLNNIEQVFLYSNQTIGATLYVGGFAGRIANASGGSSTNINGVILNNIGKLRTDVRADWGAKVNTLIGGFTAELGSGNSIHNAFLYYTANSLLMPALDSDGQLDGRHYVHTFYHAMNGGGSSLNNIKIHYSNSHTDAPYKKEPVGSLPSDVRFGYTAKGMIEGIRLYGRDYLLGEKTTDYYKGKVTFSGYTDRGGNFQNIVNGYNGVKVNGGNYSWVKQERISNTYPMNAHHNTSGDYTTLINTYLPQIIDDILEADYGVTIENKDGSSTQATLQDIMNRITNILNAINSKEGEGSAVKSDSCW